MGSGFILFSSWGRAGEGQRGTTPPSALLYPFASQFWTKEYCKRTWKEIPSLARARMDSGRVILTTESKRHARQGQRLLSFYTSKWLCSKGDAANCDSLVILGSSPENLHRVSKNRHNLHQVSKHRHLGKGFPHHFWP